MTTPITGLILEGGGMRGLFTAGVLDFFLEKGVCFDVCYGVSAGACHACSYLSGQKGRARAVSLDYLQDKRYCGLYSLLTTGDIFGAKMCYDTIPNKLNHFDYETFRHCATRFHAVITNCRTGNAEYPLIQDLAQPVTTKEGKPEGTELDYVRASGSLPLVSRFVWLNNQPYLDGGMSDALPLMEAHRQGCRKKVVVCTRPMDYRKEASRFFLLFRLRYRAYHDLTKKIRDRHERYNRSLDQLRAAEASGDAFVIRPPFALQTRLVEKKAQKLDHIYQIGYDEAARRYPAMKRYLNGVPAR